MQPIKCTKEAFTIQGITAVTSNEQEMTKDAKIPALWNMYFEQQMTESITGSSEPRTLFALYSNYQEGVKGIYDVTIGVEANSNNQPQVVSKTIPAATYLMFTSAKGPMVEIVVELWQHIWKWFEENDVKRTFTGDFELYDERCADSSSAQVDIYIAIE